MKLRATLLSAILVVSGMNPAKAGHHLSAQELGAIDFPTSGNAAAQRLFIKGVLLMHSFEYDDAREAFVEAQKADPAFAMAFWGEAMTFNHPVWQRTSPDLAKAALNKLAATADARRAKAPTEKKKTGWAPSSGCLAPATLRLRSAQASSPATSPMPTR
jgi:hypothetical protein